MAWEERVCNAYKRGPGIHVPKKQKTKKKEIERERERERESKTQKTEKKKEFHHMGKNKSPASTTFSNSSYCIRFFSSQIYKFGTTYKVYTYQLGK